jgi:exopolyphosphatase/guanosine-5'-triphosphate,3'-diphosphate pyrophosphatase
MVNKSQLIAAIDVGTNSFHMVVASVDNKGMLSIKSRDKEMVRLGSSGGDMKYLQPDAIRRGVNTLKNFSEIAKSLGADVFAVATSATREAINKEEFLEKAKREVGIDIEVISGLEEARLIYIGALHALPIYDTKTLIIDIGGGSTETVVGFQSEMLFSNSQKLGSIRMTKAFFPDGEPSSQQIEACRNYIRGVWSTKLKMIKEIGFDKVIGTSGTIQTLAAMALAANHEPLPEILNGITIKAADILKIIQKIIKAKNNKVRAAMPGMELKRADIILGGALILEQILLELNIDKITISAYALREGIVFDKHSKKINNDSFGHLTHLRYDTIKNLCEHFKIDNVHAEHVRETALNIFDGLQSYHGLTSKERELLEAASMLHDVGYHISHDGHHKHSYYILLHCMMPGFTNAEAEIIANIARYHRKSHPKRKHSGFASLSSDKQNTVRILSGILRIAEGVDRRQQQLVSSVAAKMENGNILITLYADSSKQLPDIELWGANRRKMLLEEAMSLEVKFELVKE